MKWLAVVFGIVVMLGCSDNKSAESAEAETGFNYESFSKHYATGRLPYQLSDTALQRNRDTARIASAQLVPFVADSLIKHIFVKSTGIRYIPLQKVETPKSESYFITKAVAAGKTVALLTVFDKEHTKGATFPFLVPDADAGTAQISSIDNSFSITRNTNRRDKNDVLTEGKDVYAYNADANGFTLIMTDKLQDKTPELINPIDTLPRRNRYSGDYVKDKKNIVSIRDGRTASELQFFVHFEKDKGECIGELKGTLFMTSTTTAVFRPSGDPCVLDVRFTPTSVSLHEAEGCGSHRGLKCLFDDTYPRKGITRAKAAKKATAKK